MRREARILQGLLDSHPLVGGIEITSFQPVLFHPRQLRRPWAGGFDLSSGDAQFPTPLYFMSRKSRGVPRMINTFILAPMGWAWVGLVGMNPV